MARVSFSLRRALSPSDLVGVGSYNRGTIPLQVSAGATSVDEDSAIRSTGIITSIPISAESSFEAQVVGYNDVELSWSLSEPFTLVGDVPPGETRLINVIVVYSPTGFPETVQDGEALFEGVGEVYNHQTSYTIQTDQGPLTVLVPESGKWAYYSLFALYNENGPNGTYYYNKLASLEILVPNNYGSTDLLWSRIPKYYRDMDASTNNQLYRFVSIFGFELDKFRSLIDATMVQYDPLLAESEATDQLAKMIGLEVGVSDVGVSRTRALLHDIGYLRRTKGTLDSILGYITAVGGSRVTYDISGSAPYYTFYVDAQRANLVANPRFVGKATPNWTIIPQNPVTIDNSSAEGVTITAGGSDTLIAIQSTVQVPVDSATSYYASMELTGDYIVYEPRWSSSASWASWASASVAPPVIDLGDNRYAASAVPAPSTGLYYPVFVLKLLAGESVTINKWMVEPNNYGSFFDGDTIFGGYLYQNLSTDYLWETPSSPRTGYSTYTANRKKTQDAIERLLPKILPVTLLGGVTPKYDIYFDWVPGKTP